VNGKETLLLAALIALALTACGQNGRYSGTAIMEGTHQIETGETVHGALVILGGQTQLQPDARVAGPVYILDGRLEADGNIDEDLSLIGGALAVGPHARIGGNLNVGGGTLVRAPEATIGGRINRGSGVQMPERPVWTGGVRALVTRLLVETVLLAALTFLVVRLLPQPLARIERAAVGHPVISGALGLLATIVGPSLLVMMAFTIILIPVTMLGILLAVAMVTYGWMALGQAVGQPLVRALGWDLQPAGAAALGTAALTLGANVVAFVPAVGGLLPLLAAVVGLGAVLLTRFGFQTYVPAAEAY